jgi:exodeoxyribonuclease VII large subunit
MRMESENLLSPDKVYTVSEITRLIKQELESRFPEVWVMGEVSGFTRAHSGHLYFTLKDKDSQITAVMWRSLAEKVPFELENGLEVVCKGRINVYEPRGQYQLQVQQVEPKGKGALQLAFEQLKEKLHQEGLFDPELKKKLPLLPKKVGVVTSPRGAAVIDIIRTLERRFAHLHLLIYPVKVQGEGAAEEIAGGLDYFAAQQDVDVVIVGRGGGSIEDLWAFNEEGVARAIFRCSIPVISAVGHEVDFTIADFVADIRASTPTAAAEMVIEKEEMFVERIENFEKIIIHRLQYATQEWKNRVLGLIHHRAFQNFKVKLMILSQRLDELEMRALDYIRSKQQRISECKSRAQLLEERMGNSLREKIQLLKAKWERLAASLHNLSPMNILKKGYTLCWDRGGKQLVRRIDDVKAGENMTVSFYQGEFTCKVEAIDEKKTIKERIKG